jgi:predicted  nucleic acid-binding Zn-ribbon protein
VSQPSKYKAPRCLRCRGVLIPEHDLAGRTVSVGCPICGDRRFRDVKRHAAKATPREVVKGIPQSYGGVRI